MDNFKIDHGSTIYFSGQHRLEALKFSLNRNLGFSKSLKSFFSLKVTIPPCANNQKYMKDCLNTTRTLLEKKIVTRIITPSGFDAFGKRGDAKNYSRKVVVRTWPYIGIMHPGHSALSIKNDMHHNCIHKYISHWPSDKQAKENHKAFFDESSKVGVLMQNKFAHNHDRYIEDKYKELSDRSRVKLKSGDYKPRENQKLLARGFQRDGGEFDEKAWVVSADKVYIPMSGFNSTQNTRKETEKFSLFGLNEASLIEFWNNNEEKIKNGNQYYKFLSKRENCVGTVVSALEYGGAGLYIKDLWVNKFFRNPSYVHRLAIKIQERVDTLNKRSDEIIERLRLKYHSSDRAMLRLKVESV